MSFLRIYDPDSREHRMNVTQFRSPMNASINSVQTKTMLKHFPIRAGQPDINFTVQYNSMDDKHNFEGFVRQHQVSAQNRGLDAAVTLWWPERNIENWTGFIVQYTVNEKRFEVAPRATFGVSLVKSMMSDRTTLASRGIDVAKIFGIQIPQYRGYNDLMLIEPTFTDTTQPVNPQDVPGQPAAPTSPIAPPGIGR